MRIQPLLLSVSLSLPLLFACGDDASSSGKALYAGR